MSHHEIAPGQKTLSSGTASRRLRPPVTLVSSNPPHRADTSGYTPQHPLPTRRAGVAHIIAACVPDALIGSETARDTMRARLADMPLPVFFMVALGALDLLGLYAVLQGVL